MYEAVFEAGHSVSEGPAMSRAVFVAGHGVMSRGRRAFWVELPGLGAIVAAGGA